MKLLKIIADNYENFLLERWRKKKQFDKIVKWYYRQNKVFETNLPMTEQFVKYFENAIVCQRCGKCCKQSWTGPKGIAVQDKYEIRALAKYLGLRENSFRDAYCFQVNKEKDQWAIKIPCPFFEDTIHECKIYSMRPSVCLFFPVQQPVLKQVQNKIYPTITLSPDCLAVQKFLKEILLPGKKFSFKGRKKLKFIIKEKLKMWNPFRSKEKELEKDKSFYGSIGTLSAPLLEKLNAAANADGYLIMITDVKGTQLNHTYFTKEFPNGDIMPTLDEYAKLLEKEVPKQ